MTEILRRTGVVGKFVEYFGPGLSSMTIADRATIANMSPEYGGRAASSRSTSRPSSLRLTGRPKERIELVEAYCKENLLWQEPEQQPTYTQVVELDLSQVEPSLRRVRLGLAPWEPRTMRLGAHARPLLRVSRKRDPRPYRCPRRRRERAYSWNERRVALGVRRRDIVAVREMEREMKRELKWPPEVVETREVRGGTFWGLLRIGMGWIFFWAFLDKLLALGFATGRNPETGSVDYFGDAAWINGGSPTDGFLSFGLHTKWFFQDFYSSLAGQGWVDWVYMLSMLSIGLALMFGILVRPAAIAGILWMGMFYTAAAIWPENNLFLDDHVIYALVLVAIIWVSAGRYLGFGRWWERLDVVRRNRILA